LSILPRPFLKWAGGKSRLIAQYQPYLPQKYQTYYEPFIGGGALFFHLQPAKAILSDINPDLVNVYTCIRDRVEEVIQGLQHHSIRHSPDYYYQTRANVPTSPTDKAARLIYLNKTCFNGLYRVNAQGGFNVPIGRYKNPTICDPDLLRNAAIALKEAIILERPFEDILSDRTVPHDFIYFDPPYHPLSETSNFTSYSRHAFGAEHQIQLRDVFAQLAEKGVQVMQSNSDCPFIRDLYQDFQIYTIEASRSINSNRFKRGKINEVLITSY
jgi:DNA adenine methylase